VLRHLNYAATWWSAVRCLSHKIVIASAIVLRSSDMFHLQNFHKAYMRRGKKKSHPKFCFVKLYFAWIVPQKGTIYHQMEKYRIIGSLLDTNYLQKLAISLDNVWFSLSGKVDSQTTYVSIKKIPHASREVFFTEPYKVAITREITWPVFFEETSSDV